VQFNKRLQPTAGRYDEQFGFFAVRLPVGPGRDGSRKYSAVRREEALISEFLTENTAGFGRIFCRRSRSLFLDRQRCEMVALR